MIFSFCKNWILLNWLPSFNGNPSFKVIVYFIFNKELHPFNVVKFAVKSNVLFPFVSSSVTKCKIIFPFFSSTLSTFLSSSYNPQCCKPDWELGPKNSFSSWLEYTVVPVAWTLNISFVILLWSISRLDVFKTTESIASPSS